MKDSDLHALFVLTIKKHKTSAQLLFWKENLGNSVTIEDLVKNEILVEMGNYVKLNPEYQGLIYTSKDFADFEEKVKKYKEQKQIRKKVHTSRMQSKKKPSSNALYQSKLMDNIGNINYYKQTKNKIHTIKIECYKNLTLDTTYNNSMENIHEGKYKIDTIPPPKTPKTYNSPN